MKNRIVNLLAFCFIIFNLTAQTKVDSTSIKNQQLINGIKNRINTIENIGNPDNNCAKKVNDLTAKVKAQQDTITNLRKELNEQSNKTSLIKYTGKYLNNKSDKELNNELNNNASVNKDIGSCNCVRLFYKPYQTELNYKEFIQIDSILNICKLNLSYKLKLVGHADKTGDESTNLELSEKRVIALRNYLLKSANLSADRVITEWHGSAIPSQDVASPDKQFLNRRVEIILFE